MTVADYANADPAVVKSGRVKKAVANAVEKEGTDLLLLQKSAGHSAGQPGLFSLINIRS